MAEDAKFQKVVELMKRAEFRPKTEEHLRVYLFSLMDDPLFDQLTDLFDRNHDVFDSFAKAFRLKRHYMEHGGSQKEWDFVFRTERDVMTLADKDTAPVAAEQVGGIDTGDDSNN